MKSTKLLFPIFVVILVFTFLSGMLVGNNTSNRASNANNTVGAIQGLDELKSLIDKYFIGDQPATDLANENILRAYVESLQDQYSYYLSPSETKSYFESSSGSYEGIGVELRYDGENTYIGTVFKDQPAFIAGVLEGEIITKVQDESAIGLRPEVLVAKIKGPAGSKVKLTLYSSQTLQERVVEVERRLVDLDNITYEILDGNIAKINITRFTEGSGDGNGLYEFITLWDKVAKAVAAKNPVGVIVDLRNNPGGYVEGVKYITEEFLTGNQVLLQEKTVDEKITQFTDTRNGVLENIPVVILVNQNSASASEIFASALQDNNRAKVVGMPTVGKGVEGIMLQLTDGSLVVLTNKYWLTPNGNQITAETPIKPDVEVSNPEDQLPKALEILTSN